jgi:hypothetical protein
MKFIGKIFQLFLLLLVFTVGLNSCTKEGMIEVTPKTLPEYIAQMGPFVNSELPIVRTCAVGYDKKNYSVSLNAVTATALTTVKAAYSCFIVSPSLTVPQLVAGNLTLGAPGKVFWTGINLCDKRPLNDAIVAANALNASTLAGTTTGTVPAAAKTTFTTAIAATVTTRDAVTTTIDRQVTEALTKLSDATNTFKAAINK